MKDVFILRYSVPCKSYFRPSGVLYPPIPLGQYPDQGLPYTSTHHVQKPRNPVVFRKPFRALFQATSDQNSSVLIICCIAYTGCSFSSIVLESLPYTYIQKCAVSTITLSAVKTLFDPKLQRSARYQWHIAWTDVGQKGLFARHG